MKAIGNELKEMLWQTSSTSTRLVGAVLQLALLSVCDVALQGDCHLDGASPPSGSDAEGTCFTAEVALLPDDRFGTRYLTVSFRALGDIRGRYLRV